MVIILILLFVIAFFLALLSMRDFRIPHEVHKITSAKKKRGTFVIYKNKITHYKRS